MSAEKGTWDIIAESRGTCARSQKNGANTAFRFTAKAAF